MGMHLVAAGGEKVAHRVGRVHLHGLAQGRELVELLLGLDQEALQQEGRAEPGAVKLADVHADLQFGGGNGVHGAPVSIGIV